MWHDYIIPTNLQDAIQALNQPSKNIKIIAGGTDLYLEMERGIKKGIDTLVDITRVPSLDQITLDVNGFVHIGPLVTHNDCCVSEIIRKNGLPLAMASWEVGAPQIRNVGTVAGNMVTASPANDTISPLMALKATITLLSTRGERKINIGDFYLGVRKTVIEPDEIVIDIAFPALKDDQRATYMKLGLRRAQAISLVNMAVALTINNETITDASITLGAVAPTVIHARNTEEFLVGKTISPQVIEDAGIIAMSDSSPIGDVRASLEYRHAMVKVLTQRCLKEIYTQQSLDTLPGKPIELNTRDNTKKYSLDGQYRSGMPIATRINGIDYSFTSGQDKNLLRLIRENGGLTGTKEGCGEGECGACTLFLDGKAVMSCLIPAPRAHKAVITTIEGISSNNGMNPVQQAFVEHGAVQCGYCTPGFVMAATKLLEEKNQPNRDDILTAISGNLCRCTGYYKIIQAIEAAIDSN
jgi:carbon-monoxide dehydrogenase medium subunit